VHTGLLGTKWSLVPLAGAAPAGEDVQVRVSKEQVKGAPSVEPDRELTEREEIELFRYYGVPYPDERSVTAGGTPGPAAARADGVASRCSSRARRYRR
jgi:hypothetical protein